MTHLSDEALERRARELKQEWGTLSALRLHRESYRLLEEAEDRVIASQNAAEHHGMMETARHERILSKSIDAHLKALCEVLGVEATDTLKP